LRWPFPDLAPLGACTIFCWTDAMSSDFDATLDSS